MLTHNVPHAVRMHAVINRNLTADNRYRNPHGASVRVASLSSQSPEPPNQDNKRSARIALRQAVLGAVAATNRGGVDAIDGRTRVLEAVVQLEATSEMPLQDPKQVLALLDGTWSLVYSTKASSESTTLQTDPDFVQKVTGVLYKAFFKFAPFLAGSQDTGGSSSVSNLQIVDLASGMIDNRVFINLPGNNKLNIRVHGDVEAAETSSADLKVTFTGWELGLGDGEAPFLKLPLPRPVGYLKTTFCDDEIRIARGGRGGIFITKRLGSNK